MKLKQLTHYYKAMNTYILLTITASVPLLLHAGRTDLRVRHGVTDTEAKYPYVVALLLHRFVRVGTGTLISPEWVLTAGHCLDESISHVQFGNMSIMPMISRTVTVIVDKIQHPSYQRARVMNDIGICRVMPVLMETYGRLSAVDYTSLMGQTVQYAGYGRTHHQDVATDLFNRPLQVGEGIVVSAKALAGSIAPTICVAPKCSNKFADAASGDSGGPLFHDGKLVGIVSWGDNLLPIGRYTAISPYLTWIQEVVDPPNFRKKFMRGKFRRRKYLIKRPKS